jgi:sporulation protein YlmC with PRC-barrel domain
MKIFDRELLGRAVIAADGRVIGKVAGISIETEGTSLTSLEIELRRPLEEELGVEHHLFRASKIEVPFAEVQSIGDTVVLSIPFEALQKTSMRAHAHPSPA